MDKTVSTGFIKRFIAAIDWKRIISITSIMIPLVIAPSTGLLIFSQDSKPGDFLYPYKRGTELIILAGASLNPGTKAFFHVDLAERRFNEAEMLLIAKADASGLNEFASEIRNAKSAVIANPDSAQRKELSKKLISKIDDYQVRLTKFQTSNSQNLTVNSNISPSAFPSQVITDSALPTPTVVLQSTPIIKPVETQIVNTTVVVTISNIQTQIEIIKQELQQVQAPGSNPLAAPSVLPSSSPTQEVGRGNNGRSDNSQGHGQNRGGGVNQGSDNSNKNDNNSSNRNN